MSGKNESSSRPQIPHRRQCLNHLARLLLRQPNLINSLQIQPELRAGPKKMRQPLRCVPRDRAPPVQNLRNAVRRNPDLPRQHRRVHSHFLQLFGQVLAWVYRFHGFAYLNGRFHRAYLSGLSRSAIGDLIVTAKAVTYHPSPDL